MHNMVYLIGRLTKNPEIVELESGKKATNLTLAVQRNYKNEEGVYETDFINCSLWDMVAERTTEYCHQGDLVGIKGRLATYSYEKDGKKESKLNVNVDKISFLASKREDIEVKEPELA